MNAVPEGWRPIPRLSPFNALVGPLYQRSAGESLSIGLRIEEKHGNSRGIRRRRRHRARQRHLCARGEGVVARDVVLAPGLWMPGAAMTLLAARLARAGY